MTSRDHSDDFDEATDDDSWYDDETEDEADDDAAETLSCPACGADVYEDSVRCPACGAYMTPGEHLSPIWWWTAVLLLVTLGSAYLIWIL